MTAVSTSPMTAFSSPENEKLQDIPSERKTRSGRNRLKGIGATLRDEWFKEVTRSGGKPTAQEKKNILERIQETDPWYSLNTLNCWIYNQTFSKRTDCDLVMDPLHSRFKAFAPKSAKLQSEEKEKESIACTLSAVRHSDSRDQTGLLYGISLNSEKEVEGFAELLGTDVATVKRLQPETHSQSPPSKTASSCLSDVIINDQEKTIPLERQKPFPPETLEQFIRCIAEHEKTLDVVLEMMK